MTVLPAMLELWCTIEVFVGHAFVRRPSLAGTSRPVSLADDQKPIAVQVGFLLFPRPLVQDLKRKFRS